MKEKLLNSSRSFMAFFLGWAILMLLMRIGEWLINGYQHQFPAANRSFLLSALLADLVFISTTGLILYIVFVLLGFLSLKIARIFLLLILVFCTIGYFALQQYFLSTGVLLGADLYGYSMKDIQQTTGASGGLNWKTIGLMVLLVAALVFLFMKTSKKFQPGRKWSLGLITALLLVTVLTSAGYKPRPSFTKEFDTNLAQNKLDYFLQASYGYFFPEAHELDIYSDAYSGDFVSTGDDVVTSFTYVDESNYPFLHVDSTHDVLSPFFKTAPQAPNVVIILVEGLGRAFTNDGAYLGNFTPFLDSLSRNSLYWENFLSGGGRTFAVLPSVLGSLPFGKNGFNEMKGNMPAHQSLVSLLKKNGYNTSFYYSGDASFDNMDYFLQQQGINAINDKKTFPSGYQQLPANNGFSWGYGDKELYRYFLSAAAPTTPTLDVLLTVSTHSPFLIPDAPKYQQLFDDRLTQITLTDAQKAEARAYKQQLVTVMYADDALRGFFNEASKKPGFANTIFLITGDHRLPEIPMSSKIDRYHVPLIVYSPLLQRTARFQSISSHMDITPSLLAFLKKSYNVHTPSLASWVGSGLDTARAFRNVHGQTLMQTKTDIIDYIRGTYHLNGDNLYRLTASLQEEPVTDEGIKAGLKAGLNQYLEKNQRMINGAKLLPDSLQSK